MNFPDLFLHWWEVSSIDVLGSGMVYFYLQVHSKIPKDTTFCSLMVKTEAVKAYKAAARGQKQ